jgi:hypothetical protein
VGLEMSVVVAGYGADYCPVILKIIEAVHEIAQ